MVMTDKCMLCYVYGAAVDSQWLERASTRSLFILSQEVPSSLSCAAVADCSLSGMSVGACCRRDTFNELAKRHLSSLVRAACLYNARTIATILNPTLLCLQPTIVI